MPEFYVIFARKNARILHNNFAQKYIFPNFWGTFPHCPCLLRLYDAMIVLCWFGVTNDDNDDEMEMGQWVMDHCHAVTH